jgi:hypothetical protein
MASSARLCYVSLGRNLCILQVLSVSCLCTTLRSTRTPVYTLDLLCPQVFCAHPGLTRTDHFGKADTDAKWSSRWVEAFANSFWGTDEAWGHCHSCSHAQSHASTVRGQVVGVFCGQTSPPPPPGVGALPFMFACTEPRLNGEAG